MTYAITGEYIPPLWRGEGFGSQAEMDEWFRSLVKQGYTTQSALMDFILHHKEIDQCNKS